MFFENAAEADAALIDGHSTDILRSASRAEADAALIDGHLGVDSEIGATRFSA